MVMAVSNDKPEVESRVIQNFLSEQVEGIIIAPVNYMNNNVSYIKQLIKSGTPFVFSTSRYPDLDVPSVMVDLEEGMYKLVKYLLDLGHRKIIFICGIKGVVTTDLRISGYKKAFSERGLEVNEDNFIECIRVDYEEAQKASKRLLNEKASFDAVIALNDFMAVGIMNVLKSSGLSIPEEVSVAGYDNTVFSSIASTTITTVNQDIKLISRDSVDMVISKLSNRELFVDSILIKPELIIRESTGIRKRD